MHALVVGAGRRRRCSRVEAMAAVCLVAGLLGIGGLTRALPAFAAAKGVELAGVEDRIGVGQADVFQVLATNADGSIDPGYRGTVTFSSTGSSGTVTPNPYTFTDADRGRHGFTVTWSTTGSKTLTVTDAATGLGYAQPVTVLSTAATPQGVLWDLGVDDAVVGQPDTFVVAALRADGTFESSYRGTVTFTTTSGSGVVVPNPYTFTEADQGQHSFTVTWSTAGSKTLTIDDKSGTIVGARTRSINVTAGSLTAPQTSTATLTASPSAAVPGQAVTLTGVGFAPGEIVDLSIDGSPLSPPTATTDAAGAFNQLVTVPGVSSAATRAAQARGRTSGRTGAATLTVTTVAPPAPPPISPPILPIVSPQPPVTPTVVTPNPIVPPLPSVGGSRPGPVVDRVVPVTGRMPITGSSSRRTAFWGGAALIYGLVLLSLPASARRRRT